MQLLEQKVLHVALKAITKSTVVTRQRVQDVAVQAVAYSIIHGDTSIGKMLLEAISVNKALRKDSLIAYFEKYGNFAWVKADKALKFRATYKVGTLTSDHEALILSKRWDEAKREGEVVSIYDMEKQFALFIGKMDKHALDPANTIENIEVLQAVRNVFNRIVAEKTLKECVGLDEAATKAAADAAKDEAATPKPMTNREALVQKLKDEAKDEALPVIDSKLAAVS